MIEVSDLAFHYRDGDFSLRIPVLSVARGETVAAVGPSGSGKTTFLNLLAGVVRPQAGRVTTAGVEVSALDDAARRDFRIRNVGFVFQDFELLDHLSIFDNILLPYRVNAALRLSPEIRERARTLAQDVGVGDKLHRNVRHLSQGERQRVAVCRALLPEPGLVLADEPTGNLDPVNREHVLDIVFEQAAKSGSTLLVVTHDHEILERFDRVIDFKDFL